MSIFNRPGVRPVSEAVTANLGAGAHPRISIKGGRFTLIDAGGTKHPWPSLKLPIIVVGANPEKSKVYYAGKFDPNSDVVVPPTCYSDNGIGPSKNAPQPQARTCAECPLGAWKADGTGKDCNDKKKLAVIVVGDTAQMVYELQIPPASLKALHKHAGLVGSSTVPDGDRNADLCDIVTNVSFVPDEVGILQFDAVAWIDSVGPDNQLYNGTAPDGGEAIAARIDTIMNSDHWKSLVGMNDVPWQTPALVAPAPQQALPAPTGAYAGPAGVPPTEPRAAFPANPAPVATLPARAAPVPSEPASPPSRRGGARTGAGRPKAEPQVIPPTQAPFQQAGAPAASETPIPSFLQRAPATASAPNSAPNGPAFAAPSAPPGGIQDAINQAFSLNTKRN